MATLTVWLLFRCGATVDAVMIVLGVLAVPLLMLALAAVVLLLAAHPAPERRPARHRARPGAR